MLLFVYTTTHKRFAIFTRRYFKFSSNITTLSQSNCRNFSCSSKTYITTFSIVFLCSTKLTPPNRARTQHELHQYFGTMGQCSSGESQWYYNELHDYLQGITWRRCKQPKSKCCNNSSNSDRFKEIHKLQHYRVCFYFEGTRKCQPTYHRDHRRR